MVSIDAQRVLDELNKDASKIRATIEGQNCSCITECKAFEEVIDTQMYGLSREVDFAVRLGIVDANEAQLLLRQLEIAVNQIYDDFYEEEV